VADNTTPSANPIVAADDLGSGLYVQRVKIGKGVDGAFRDVSDSYTTGTINAANANLTTGTATANSSVSLTVPDTHATWVAFLNGTWSSTTRLRFQGSPDNISWYAINGKIAGASTVNETASDLYADPVGGIIAVPVTFTGSTLQFLVTLATAGAYNLHLVKRSTISTSGTAVTQTNVPHDSTSAAAVAVNKLYTVAPTAGTTVGIVRHNRAWGFATTLTATQPLGDFIWEFGNGPQQAHVLQAGQALSLQSPAAFGTAPTITGSVEWSEE
jgi:hypothetical protein